jgi:RNA polymerase sigma-70 factor (sigma-E family)
MPGWSDDGGDAYAGFAAFVHARQGALMRSAYLITGDRQLAEDLLQGALIKLAERWRRLSGGDPEAYVRKVLYHDAVSRWRRHRRERLTGEPAETPAAGPDLAEAVVRRTEVERALANLTAKQRSVLVLRFFDDLSEAQAAQILGVSIGTVKSQTHDALRRLRAQLAEYGTVGTEA